MGPFEYYIQSQTEPSIQQFSLLVLQLNNKALVIVVKFEPMFSRSYQMMFEGCFKNTKEQMVSHISNKTSHCFWFQEPLNLLIKERRANYIIAIFLHILEFLSA